MAEEKQGTPLINDQPADWGNDNRIIEPKEFADADKEEEQKPEEIEVEEEKEEPEQVVVEEQPVGVEDPGEFEPKDYSFDVVIYGPKGGNGRTVTVKSIEQWDDIIDKESNLGSATALLKAERAANRMAQGGERDKADWDKDKAKYDEAVKAQEARTESTDRLINEMSYLEDRGDISKIPTKYKENWNTAEAKKDSAVVQQKALLDFMAKENNARQKAGLKPMDSLLDAYNAWQVDENKKATTEAKETAAEQRKAAGAKVAGSSPAPVGAAPKGIAVGRVGRLEDLGSNW